MRSTTQLRQTNEDFGVYSPGSGQLANLTKMQQRYAAWWHRVHPMQCGTKEFTSLVVGFKGSRGPDGRVVPLGPDTRIRHISSVLLLSMVPIRKSLYLPASQIRNGKYRLHYAEHPAMVDNGDLVFGDGGPSWHARQADLSKRPYQDHQVYVQQDYSPNSVGEQITAALDQPSEENVLKAPFYGSFAVVRNDLHLRLTIEGVDVFRFLLADVEALEILKGDGTVAKGEPLARLTRAVSYLAAEPWASNPEARTMEPDMDRIHGDTLSATRCEPQLSFCVGALESMADHDLVPYRPGDGQRLLGLNHYLPRHLVQITLADLAQRRVAGWLPNTELKQRILQAVSPDALTNDSLCLGVRAPVDGRLAAVALRGQSQLLSFCASTGSHLLVVPKCAELQVEVGSEVRKGQLLGDLVPRGYYPDYEGLEMIADGAISKIEDAFLDTVVIHSGQHDWHGDGVLLDKQLAGSLADKAVGHYLDMQPALNWVNAQYGIAILPPDPSLVLERQCHGIRYDLTPAGRQFAGLRSKLASSGSQPQRSRRRRNKKRATA